MISAHPINSGGKRKKSYLCIMENSMLESLVSFMRKHSANYRY